MQSCCGDSRKASLTSMQCQQLRTGRRVAFIALSACRAEPGKGSLCLRLQGFSQKTYAYLDGLATGGEAEPSPPWRVCPGCAFTQPPPILLRYGASFARQTFVPRLYLRQRAGCLRTSPQNPVSPARWCSSPRPRRRQSLHHRSPSIGWGGPSIRRRDARRKHVGSCIRVYASPMGMKREWKKSALKRAMLDGE